MLIFMFFEWLNFLCYNLLSLFLEACFWYFNTISAIIFLWCLPTNKPIILIPCHALPDSSVLSPSAILSDVTIVSCLFSFRGFRCSLTSKWTCGHCASNTWSTAREPALSSDTFLLVFTCCGMMTLLLADEAGLKCLKIAILFPCFSQCLFVTSPCFLHITHLLKKTFNLNSLYFS